MGEQLASKIDADPKALTGGPIGALKKPALAIDDPAEPGSAMTTAKLLTGDDIAPVLDGNGDDL